MFENTNRILKGYKVKNPKWYHYITHDVLATLLVTKIQITG